MAFGMTVLTPAMELRGGVQRESRVDEAQALLLLITRCVAGEAAAWEQIVRLYNRRIYNICYRFSGSSDDAEDLTQEVFIRLYKTLASFDGARASFNTWVTTVTRNLLVDHFRKTKYDRQTGSLDAPLGDEEGGATMVDMLVSGEAGPERAMERVELKDLVQQALTKLSPELREAVILRDLQEMDYKEIAQSLRIPEGTVKSRINRGRAELARLLHRTSRQEA
jgi:RNA polymerase sigma-70 factor (ECF subfamily)